MTDKQKRFCDEYLVDCCATQAAIRAGYSPKTANEQASRLLANVNIREYLDERLEEIKNRKTAESAEVMEYLTAVMRGEHTEQVLRLIGDGVQKIDNIKVSEKDRLKAAELLGKRYGLFKDSVDVSVAPVVLQDDIKE